MFHFLLSHFIDDIFKALTQVFTKSTETYKAETQSKIFLLQVCKGNKACVKDQKFCQEG